MTVKGILHVSRFLALFVAYYLFLVPYALLIRRKRMPKRMPSTLEFKTIPFSKMDLKEPF